MKTINRRRFLTVAGAGAVATAALPGVSVAQGLAGGAPTGSLTFRAVAGLPGAPLASFASYVVDGHIDLATRAGHVTTTVVAAPPAALRTSVIAGRGQRIRIIDVRQWGQTLQLRGLVADRVPGQRGARQPFALRLDPVRRVAATVFLGSEVLLSLEQREDPAR